MRMDFWHLEFSRITLNGHVFFAVAVFMHASDSGISIKRLRMKVSKQAPKDIPICSQVCTFFCSVCKFLDEDESG